MTRPTKYDTQAMDNYTVRLTAMHARIARRIGLGNLAEGIRRLIEGSTDERVGVIAHSDEECTIALSGGRLT